MERERDDYWNDDYWEGSGFDAETIAYLKREFAKDDERERQWCRDYRLSNIERDIERAGQCVGAEERLEYGGKTAEPKGSDFTPETKMDKAAHCGLPKQRSRWVDVRRAIEQNRATWLVIMFLMAWVVWCLYVRFHPGALRDDDPVQPVSRWSESGEP